MPCPNLIQLVGGKQKNHNTKYHWWQGRFQDGFQGVAEISSGGGEKIARYPPSPQCFLLSYTTLLIYAHFFDILDTCYKEIHKIYCFTFSCYSFIFYTQVRVPRNVLGSGGGSKSLKMVRGWRRHPLNCLGDGEGGRATPLKSPLTGDACVCAEGSNSQTN